MFQNKHFNLNYTRIREMGENGGGDWGGDLISQCNLFLDNLFAGNNLLKQAKYVASPIKNLIPWIINNAKIN